MDALTLRIEDHQDAPILRNRQTANDRSETSPHRRDRRRRRARHAKRARCRYLSARRVQDAMHRRQCRAASCADCASLPRRRAQVACRSRDRHGPERLLKLLCDVHREATAIARFFANVARLGRRRGRRLRSVPALSIVRRVPRPPIASPIPPKRRPRPPLRSRKPRCNRAGTVTVTAHGCETSSSKSRLPKLCTRRVFRTQRQV